MIPSALLLLLAVILLISCPSNCIKLKPFDGIEIDLGEKEGLSPSSSISSDTLQKIIAGVKNGNRESLYFFGLLKLYGISVAKNSVVAAQSFKKAGELSHKEATTAYGVCLMAGTGVEQDYVSAVHWFKKGVELGDKNAHWLLGRMYVEGKGVPTPNHSEAFKLFKVAAEDNIVQAEHFLGLAYEYGRGTEQNFALAAEYYRHAAEKNFLESMYNLGLMYAYGRGFEQDFQRALPLFEAASRVDHAPSIYYMGMFKMFGYATDVDYNQAYNWFERAAGLGDIRVSERAQLAMQEIQALLQKAQETNDRVIDDYMKRSEDY